MDLYGSDNQGLDGIEAKYESVLSGENGSISKMIDAKGNNFGDDGETYDEPTVVSDGYVVMLDDGSYEVWPDYETYLEFNPSTKTR